MGSNLLYDIIVELTSSSFFIKLVLLIVLIIACFYFFSFTAREVLKSISWCISIILSRRMKDLLIFRRL